MPKPEDSKEPQPTTPEPDATDPDTPDPNATVPTDTETTDTTASGATKPDGPGPPETPNQQLAAAALAAGTPNPKPWAQGWQMGIALLALLGAFGLAFVLVFHGPPSPKAATVNLTEKTENEAGETTETTTRTGVVGAQLATAEVQPVEESPPPAESGEEGESLANLSKQGPWAFAIVALLVAAFVATGKSMNVGGSSAKKTGGNQ